MLIRMRMVDLVLSLNKVASLHNISLLSPNHRWLHHRAAHLLLTWWWSRWLWGTIKFSFSPTHPASSLTQLLTSDTSADPEKEHNAWLFKNSEMMMSLCWGIFKNVSFVKNFQMTMLSLEMFFVSLWWLYLWWQYKDVQEIHLDCLQCSGNRSGITKLGCVLYKRSIINWFLTNIIFLTLLLWGVGWFSALPWGSPSWSGCKRHPSKPHQTFCSRTLEIFHFDILPKYFSS